MASDDPVHILLLEDDEIDVRALKRAFQKNGITHPLSVASNGIEGLRILHGEGDTPPLPKPYLIILDINMPGMNGLTFLRELRRDAGLRDSVVLVLTSSEADRDIIATYDQGVAGYISKRNLGEGAMPLGELIERFSLIVQQQLSI